MKRMKEKRIVVDEEDEKLKIENKKNKSEILGETNVREEEK